MSFWEEKKVEIVMTVKKHAKKSYRLKSRLSTDSKTEYCQFCRAFNSILSCIGTKQTNFKWKDRSVMRIF